MHSTSLEESSVWSETRACNAERSKEGLEEADGEVGRLCDEHLLAHYSVQFKCSLQG
jgi:hypothetical protein